MYTHIHIHTQRSKASTTQGRALQDQNHVVWSRKAACFVVARLRGVLFSCFWQISCHKLTAGWVLGGGLGERGSGSWLLLLLWLAPLPPRRCCRWVVNLLSAHLRHCSALAYVAGASSPPQPARCSRSLLPPVLMLSPAPLRAAQTLFPVPLGNPPFRCSETCSGPP